MILDGSQKYETANNDRQNIFKLAAGRIDTIVIDVNVYQYLKSDPQVAKITPFVQMNKKVLKQKSLHIAFGNNPQGEKWLAIINRGLSKFDVQATMDASLQKTIQP
jgi:polar amino acid transport system substrate-binding protein